MPLAGAGGLAKQFGHHAAWINALGQAMAVAAVGRGHVVAISQIGAYPNRNSFFAGVQMDEAGDFAFAELELHPVFKRPNELHALVHPHQLVFAEFHAASFVGAPAYARLHSTKYKGGEHKRMARLNLSGHAGHS